MNPLLIASLISAALAGSAGFGLAWKLQAGTIAENELEQANERTTIQRAARATLERAMRQNSTSQANAAARGIRNRAAAAGAADIAGGLRIATDSAVRTAATDPAACSDAAASLGAVLTASVKEYRELAEVCDRHVSHIQTLTEQWPR